MNKEHVMRLVVVLFFVGVMISAIVSLRVTSEEGSGTKIVDSSNTLEGKGNGNSNITNSTRYINCVANVSTIKTACFNTAKTVGGTCRLNALNEVVKDQAKIIKCNQDFEKDYKKCLLDSKNAKKSCSSVKHTFFDEVAVAGYG